MKIDWKQVAKSEGYKSLKEAYIRDEHRWGKDNGRYRNGFTEAISLCIKVSHQTGISLDNVLNICESQRSYWYMNFYQAHTMEKIFGISGYTGSYRLSPSTERGEIKAIKDYFYHSIHGQFYDPALRRVLKAKRVTETKLKYRKKKNRWSKEEKDRQRRLKSL